MATTSRRTLHTVMSWSDEEARERLEQMRWPDGPVCPKCGTEKPWTIQRQEPNKNRVRKLYKCRSCRRQFTATIGTIFENSKIPLSKWLAAMFLICSSQKGISAHQLYRTLGLGSYESAWFMFHRIREAMHDKAPEMLVGTVEADETSIGPRTRRGHPAHQAPKAQGRAAGQIRGGTKDKQVVPRQSGAVGRSAPRTSPAPGGYADHARRHRRRQTRT